MTCVVLRVAAAEVKGMKYRTESASLGLRTMTSAVVTMMTSTYGQKSLKPRARRGRVSHVRSSRYATALAARMTRARLPGGAGAPAGRGRGTRRGGGAPGPT